MWKNVNSPIVITAIAIVALVLMRPTQDKIASEIRGAYDEINRILEEGGSDANKNKAIKEFAQEMATQIREGFSAGFSSNSETKNKKDTLFLETMRQIEIRDIKYVKSKWPNQEAVLFLLKNGSDKYIAQIKVNLEFYKNGVLVDCNNKMLHEIKILEPGQELAVSQTRRLPKTEDEEELEQYKSDNIKIIVTSFSIKNVGQPTSEEKKE